jgi:catechol 2,3-dioxygenase-like lactoylglutathione lyase family enzyme
MKIDHVELFVPGRHEAAAWYQKVLGFEIVEEHVDWAVEGGPLMITNDGGDTMLALFKGPSQEGEKVRGLRRLAFRVGAEDFVRFLEDSPKWRDEPVGEAKNHGKAFSVYFADPWGTPLEVTTYDYDAVKAALARD